MASVPASQSTPAADPPTGADVTTEPAKCPALERHPRLTAVEDVLAKWEGACAICMVDQDTPKSGDYVCSECKKMVCDSCHEDMEHYNNLGCSFCRNPVGFLPLGEFAADQLSVMMGIPPEAVHDAIEEILGDDWFNPSKPLAPQTPRDWFRMPLSGALAGLEFCNKDDVTAFSAWNMVKGAIGLSLGLVSDDIKRTRTCLATLRKQKVQLSKGNEALEKTVEEQATKAAEFDACKAAREAAEEQCLELKKKCAAAKGQITKHIKKAEKDKKEREKLEGLVKRLSGMLPQATCDLCGEEYPEGTKHSVAWNHTDALASHCFVPYDVSEFLVKKLGRQAVQAAAAWYTHIVACFVANIDGSGAQLEPVDEYFLRCKGSRFIQDDCLAGSFSKSIITKADLNNPNGLAVLFKRVLSTEFAGSGCADYKVLRSIHRQYLKRFFDGKDVEFTDVFEMHNASMRQFCEWVLPVAFSDRAGPRASEPFTQDLFSPDELVQCIPREVLREFINGRILNPPAPTFIGTAPFGGMGYLWDPKAEAKHYVPPEVREGLLRSAGDRASFQREENSFDRYNAAKQNYCDFTAKLAAFAKTYAGLRKKHDSCVPDVSQCAYDGCDELVDTNASKVGETARPFVQLKDGVCHYECYSKIVAQSSGASPQPSDDPEMTQELREVFKRCAHSDEFAGRKRRRCSGSPALFADARSRDTARNADNLFASAVVVVDSDSGGSVANDGDTQPYVHTPILVESDGEQE